MYKSNINHRHHSKHSYDLYDDLEKIKDALADASDDVRLKAKELFLQSIENAKERSAEIKEDVSDYVGDKPFKSLGFALISGLLIGFLLRRK